LLIKAHNIQHKQYFFKCFTVDFFFGRWYIKKRFICNQEYIDPMKKIILFFAITLFCAGCVSRVDQLRLRVAITGDAQAVDSVDHWGIVNTAKAFSFLAPFEPDVLVMSGDLADRGDPAVFDRYMELYVRYFKNKLPVQAACAGNHDFAHPEERDRNKLWQNFADGLMISRDKPGHQVIGGYDFITVSEGLRDDKIGDYTPEMIAKLKEKLDKAVARDNKKPIFVITHYPPTFTMIGSECGNGKEALRKLLNNYPQVISISGHSHRPLQWDKSFWQGEFTAFTTSTLSYGCIGGGYFVNVAGGSILPFAREVQEALLMDIYDNRVVIRRFNVHDRREIDPADPWMVDVPYNRNKAEKALQNKIATEKAPEFPEKARLLIRHDFGFAYLLFVPAYHDDMVLSYFMRASVKKSDGSWEVVKEADYVSDFYRYEKHRTSEVAIKIPENTMCPRQLMRFEVFPVSGYGKRGKPLTLEMTIPPTWKLKKSTKPIYPVE